MGQERGRRGAKGPGQPTPPSVFPSASCPASPPAALCLVTGYFPAGATVSWAGAGVGLTFPPVLGSAGLYASSSRLLLPPAGTPGPARCLVRHPPTSFQRDLDVPVLRAKAPSVGFFHACDAGGAQLLCVVRSFSPAPLTLEWLEDGQPISFAPPAEPAVAEAAGGTFRTSARLNVSLEDWQEKAYACRVTHAASGSVQEVVGRKCSGASPDPSNIRVFILPPTPAELYVSQNPKLRCVATSLPSDDGLTFHWEDREALFRLTSQFNGTFTATSELPVSTRDWESGKAFSCKVRHSELPGPRTARLARKPGKRLAPSVYVLAPPPEELSGNRATLSLTCLVRGFYPEDISVEWHKNHEALEATAYSTGQPVKEKGEELSYFLYSRLAVKREDWNGGNTFVCMVVHEGLPMKFIQRSVAKNPEFHLPEDFCHVDPEKFNGPWDTIAVFITLFLLSVCYSATVTLFKVKWLLSTLIRLKQVPAPDYKNVIQRAL